MTWNITGNIHASDYLQNQTEAMLTLFYTFFWEVPPISLITFANHKEKKKNLYKHYLDIYVNIWGMLSIGINWMDYLGCVVYCGSVRACVIIEATQLQHTYMNDSLLNLYGNSPNIDCQI